MARTARPSSIAAENNLLVVNLEGTHWFNDRIQLSSKRSKLSLDKAQRNPGIVDKVPIPGLRYASPRLLDS
jgi:hypothetical protein